MKASEGIIQKLIFIL